MNLQLPPEKQNDFHTFTNKVDQFLDQGYIVKNSDREWPPICSKFNNDFYINGDFAIIIPGTLARSYDTGRDPSWIRKQDSVLGIYHGAFVYVFRKEKLVHRCFHAFKESIKFHDKKRAYFYDPRFAE